MNKLACITMILAAVGMAAALVSCETVNDDHRIPAMAVYINLDNHGLWNTYGVAGFGMHREFIRQEGIPSDFPYSQTTYTGFGGVLLIGGMDPFTGDPNVPLAYDLSCPVECSPEIRVYVDDETYEAICPVCGSHYDVTMGGGGPLSGPAATGDVKYGLQRYLCIPQQLGGYIITRR